MKKRSLIGGALALALTAAACSSDGADSVETDTQAPTTDAPAAETETTDAPVETEPPATEPATTEAAAADEPTVNESVSITLVAYDSFPTADTSINTALDAFTADTGIDVELLIAGDTGTMLSKAALTVGNPEGDVMWGIDNTFISRAINDGIFEPYGDAPLDGIPAELTALTPNTEAVPVDFGDVCVNYDIAYFADNGLDVPATLQDLTDPQYKDLLVVQNPATSSPGLAFMMASVDEFGVDGWQAYWESLKENGVEVTDGWTDAYYGSFTWAGGGERPLVVSYGSSPPAEVIFADPARDDSPTGVIESTCFRQVEFVGVLAGTEQPEAARQLVDFLVSDTFQSELALNLFVYPSASGTALPQEFTDFAVVPETSRSLDPALIDANRSDWIDEWTTVVLG